MVGLDTPKGRRKFGEKHGPKPEAKSDQAWARRNLAMLLAVRGGAADRKKAMGLLMEDDDAGETADDKRSTAAVLTALSRHLDNPERKTVIDRNVTRSPAVIRSPRKCMISRICRRAALSSAANTAS